VIWPLLGIVVGLVNGWSIAWAVDRLQPAAAKTGAGLVLAGYFVRLLFCAGALSLAVRHGAGPALGVVAGLWLARWLVVWAVMRSKTAQQLGESRGLHG